MKRPFFKCIFLIYTFMVSFCLLTGCGSHNSDEPMNDTNQSSDSFDSAVVTQPLAMPDSSTSELRPDNPTQGQLIPVTYYSVNMDSSVVVALSSMLPVSDVSKPEKMLGLVIDSLDDESITVSLPSVTIDNSVCVIDFDDTIFSVAELGADIENAVLDAIAQSILDNIEACNSIVYRINSEAYKTVNNSFSYNQVYMDD